MTDSQTSTEVMVRVLGNLLEGLAEEFAAQPDRKFSGAEVAMSLRSTAGKLGEHPEEITEAMF